jgi:class 3 adenylate cyclase
MNDREKILAAIAALQAQRGLGDQAVTQSALEALQQELAAVDGSQKSLRLVTVVFLDFVGSTALSRLLDPEEISEIVDGALKRLTAVRSTGRCCSTPATVSRRVGGRCKKRCGGRQMRPG